MAEPNRFEIAQESVKNLIAEFVFSHKGISRVIAGILEFGSPLLITIIYETNLKGRVFFIFLALGMIGSAYLIRAALREGQRLEANERLTLEQSLMDKQLAFARSTHAFIMRDISHLVENIRHGDLGQARTETQAIQVSILRLLEGTAAALVNAEADEITVNLMVLKNQKGVESLETVEYSAQRDHRHYSKLPVDHDRPSVGAVTAFIQADPQYIPDTRKLEDIFSSRPPYRTILSIPLPLDKFEAQRCIGVVNIDSTKPNAFLKKDQTFLITHMQSLLRTLALTVVLFEYLPYLDGSNGATPLKGEPSR